MTPAARVAAAIDILDQIAAGDASEKALTRWARSSRFAGSKDRAAVRDHVFSVQRRRRSLAALGGGITGRALMLGLIRDADEDPEVMFSGEGYGPSVLSAEEVALMASDTSLSESEKLDIPDWLEPPLKASLGADYASVAKLLQSRAPVFLRVNLSKGSRADAQAKLLAEDIETKTCALVDTALEVTKNPRRVQQSEPYKSGLLDLQDLASQFVVAQLPLRADNRVLDYCAGGGGKSLAMADSGVSRIYAHDSFPLRMRDLPVRAARAGAEIILLETADIPAEAPFDLVLCDVPCSGSGAWRRSPDGKWSLTQGSLNQLLKTQTEIIDKAAEITSKTGILAYVTCSLLEAENHNQVAAFLARNSGWKLQSDHRLTPLDGGDGFYLALLTSV